MTPNQQLLVGVFGAIFDDARRILLVQRADLDMWCLPGGLHEIGESVTDTVVRECREEIAVEVRPEALVGIYSDPGRHLFRYKSGLIKHFITIVFDCRVEAGQPRPCTDEVIRIEYFEASQLPNVVPSHRIWIEDAVAGYRAQIR